ncbi:MAG: DUF1598 domain-containing protein [Planctomycetes bacterium]|nr:DUF1598 domain-containing protein [Planctomycetota bacterium]
MVRQQLSTETQYVGAEHRRGPARRSAALGAWCVLMIGTLALIGCGDSGDPPRPQTNTSEPPAIADAHEQGPSLTSANASPTSANTSPPLTKGGPGGVTADNPDAPSGIEPRSDVTKGSPAAEVAAAPQAPADAATERRDRVQAHLAAGEFGPALDLVTNIADDAERAELLKLVIEAQLAAGEFSGARRTAGRIADADHRDRLRSRRLTEQSLAGGGSMADFTQLIELIQNETSGPWEDIDGTGGTLDQFDTGVRVDPNGLLTMLTRQEQSERLKELGIAARTADLNEDMDRASDLRLVSLTRLEREIARRIETGRPIPATMRQLAGLTQIRYVFVYPASSPLARGGEAVVPPLTKGGPGGVEDPIAGSGGVGEVVIGGPAEGWRYNEMGIPVGDSAGTPTLQLDDFVTVFRIFSPNGSQFFNCLIVPRQEGLRQVKEFVEASNSRGPLRPSAVRNWTEKLQELLGPQDAVFNGVPVDSRVARVMLEADYRMKLIGIGRLDGGSGIPSYFDLLTPSAIRQNPPELDALRWWLTMKYEAVLHSAERDVFQIVGASVLCQSENELVDATGQRIHTGKADATNQQFAQNFTNNYAELARRDLVFADLQNIFDLALAAAILHREQAANRSGWTGGVFAAGGPYQPATYDPVATVMTAVNHRVYGGKDIIVQVAGGVRADLASVLADRKIYREGRRLEPVAQRARPANLPENRWWWDAAQP